MELELWVLLKAVIALALGGIIGWEREQTGKAAGLRTHMLVAMGATLFVSFTPLFVIDAQPLVPPGEPGNFRLQIEPLATIQAVVTGISFLGAGVVFFSDRHHTVKNLTTAASIWVTAAIGIAVGIERYILATGSALLVLLVLRVLQRPETAED